MSTELVAVQTAVAEFDKVAAGLQDLQARFGGILYDVTTTKGMDAAKEARAAVRAPRFEVERVRKAAKAPILALGKLIDDRAKEITAAIMAIEEPIDVQVKAEEARKEAEKQAKIDAEIKRVADIQARIATLCGNMAITPASGSATIAEHMRDLEAVVVDDSFAEFREHAQNAKATGLARFTAIHAAALAHESEQARLAAERVELDRLRAEQAEREAAESRRLAEEARRAQAEREAEDAERRRLQAIEDAERAERIAAENAEIAARRAELDRQEHEARQAREKDAAALTPPPSPPAVAAAQSLRARPRDEDIADAVAFAFGVDSTAADSWLRAYGQAAQQAA